MPVLVQLVATFPCTYRQSGEPAGVAGLKLNDWAQERTGLGTARAEETEITPEYAHYRQADNSTTC